ncbi:penicillin acylase family protein [Sphingobacteriales bacterium UPWRP_1]|nr:hypothetical protein B6N25_03940 [Sphingobacteriales bacterium TSM_CSS]PSJ76675.1 penicillin acylase family protein [Sphingobacteriales bacterium UPWRP_1]
MSVLFDILGTAGKAGLYNLSRRSLPQTAGAAQLKGLEEEVEIIRDHWGIPHIYAKNLSDLLFAQGFTHAQERFWQMELNRRAATGTLSEVFGDIALNTDIASRTFGFARLGKEDIGVLPQALRNLLQSYVDGINSFLSHHKNRISVEFSLLRFAPKPWTLEDTMAFARLMNWQLSHAWQGELIRANFADLVGAELAAELDIRYPPGNPSILHKGTEVNNPVFSGSESSFLRQNNGSNSWAISGNLTESGQPLLANDPHLHLGTPAIWYENHLHCPQLHSTGVTIAGMPLVLIGHNENMAWGITLAYTDGEDLFIEKFTDFEQGLYQYGNTVEKAQIIEEPIAVKGRKEPHIARVCITRHGPVVSDVVGYPQHRLALQSIALQPRLSYFRGWWQLNLAKDYTDFVHAVSFLSAPQLNLVFADTAGNIGYWLTGKAPIRKAGNGKLPAPGWSGEYEWTGFVPFTEMPHALNPQKGYVITANNRVIPDDYPYFLGDVWMNGYRANRLEQLITQHTNISANDCRHMQTDVFCIPGKIMANLFKEMLPEAAQLPPRYWRSWYLLADWDGYLTPHTVGGTIYELVRKFAIQNLLENAINAEWLLRFTGKGFDPVLKNFSEQMGHDITALLRILNNPDSLWLKKYGGKNALLQKSLMMATNWLTDHLGNNPEKWEWGKLHTMVAPHALGVKKPFDKVFNIGPVPMGGDGDTPLQAGTPENEIPNTHVVSASYRQVIDLGNLSQSMAVLPTGQSGHLGSPHYKDQNHLWLTGQLRPMLWTREQVVAYSNQKLVLEPK